ncbi:MAG: TIGR04283 family arsenosugar biosynthesis glycosyltransferase, partial [Terricaulis sp.]
SVVIPTLDEAERIETLIVDLIGQGFDEIVVADGGSRDATAALAAAAGAIVVSTSRGRGRQLGAGAEAAGGDILFFVHADSQPPAGARHHIEAALAKEGVSAGGFSLTFDVAHPLLRFYAFMSRINHSLFTYGDQGLFLRRSTYQRIGGYRDLPLFEDVEILQRLRRIGSVVKLNAPMVTSARRFLRDGVARRELMSAGLVALYHLGVAPARLERWYRPDKLSRE